MLLGRSCDALMTGSVLVPSTSTVASPLFSLLRLLKVQVSGGRGLAAPWPCEPQDHLCASCAAPRHLDYLWITAWRLRPDKTTGEPREMWVGCFSFRPRSSPHLAAFPQFVVRLFGSDGPSAPPPLTLCEQTHHQDSGFTSRLRVVWPEEVK